MSSHSLSTAQLSSNTSQPEEEQDFEEAVPVTPPALEPEAEKSHDPSWLEPGAEVIYYILKGLDLPDNSAAKARDSFEEAFEGHFAQAEDHLKADWFAYTSTGEGQAHDPSIEFDGVHYVSPHSTPPSLGLGFSFSEVARNQRMSWRVKASWNTDNGQWSLSADDQHSPESQMSKDGSHSQEQPTEDRGAEKFPDLTPEFGNLSVAEGTP